ncbi:TIGR02757 family protein [Flavobacteriaceae bacterium Ap0902]|nr:TIGR02757 family protein [Flavobacteriaceae bacterium Ap0902]
MNLTEVKSFLDEKALLYNQHFFIEHDPIQIPHQFAIKQDIEIAGLLAATIAWGNRKSIIKNANDMMRRMDNAPYEFVSQSQESDLDQLNGFVHRTFNDFDFKFFVSRLQALYREHDSLEHYFLIQENEHNPKEAIERFRTAFLGGQEIRTSKHISSPARNSAAKRLNMYLRWMVRQDKQGVDFGLWNQIPMTKLSLPLDVHTGNISRKLNLLHRKQNDWKAVEEIDAQLREFNPQDPIQYDFALFGLGAFEGF